MNTITNKKNVRKINKAMAIVLFIAVFVMSTATFASANEASEALKDLADYIFAIGQVIGVIIAFFGIIQIGQSIPTHDPAQRATGFLVVAGGVIIFFAENLLDLIGVNV